MADPLGFEPRPSNFSFDDVLVYEHSVVCWTKVCRCYLRRVYCSATPLGTRPLVGVVGIAPTLSFENRSYVDVFYRAFQRGEPGRAALVGTGSGEQQVMALRLAVLTSAISPLYGGALL